jgi:uncharacterized RmlC-like cupin family protein
MRKKVPFLVIAIASMAVPSEAAQDAAIANFPAASLRWETTKEGVGFAPLIGDRFADPYMAMVRLPAGLVSPSHVKSANMFGVVLSGTISHIAVGADASTEVLLPKGSFYKIPAGIGHVSKCLSAEDCITFVYQDGKFDFLPTTK